jgi:hypothetical protein
MALLSRLAQLSGLACLTACSSESERRSLDRETAALIAGAELVEVFQVYSARIPRAGAEDRGLSSFRAYSGPHRASLRFDPVAESWRRERVSDAPCECGTVVIFRGESGAAELLVSATCGRLFLVRGGNVLAVADVGSRAQTFAVWDAPGPTLGYLD